jgi:hypothetical protein
VARGFQEDKGKVKQSVTGLEWSRRFQEVKVKVKVKQSVTGLEWPRGF